MRRFSSIAAMRDSYLAKLPGGKSKKWQRRRQREYRKSIELLVARSSNSIEYRLPIGQTDEVQKENPFMPDEW